MRKRSKYRPQGVNIAAHQMAMRGAALLNERDIAEFVGPVRQAVASITTAQETRDDWRAVFGAVNVTEALLESRVSGDRPHEWRQWVDDVQTAALTVISRRSDRPKAALHAEEARHLRSIVGTYETACRAVTCRQMLEARRRAGRKVGQALARPDKPCGVTVVEPASPYLTPGETASLILHGIEQGAQLGGPGPVEQGAA